MASTSVPHTLVLLQQIFWHGGGIAMPRNGPRLGNDCHGGILNQHKAKIQSWVYQHGKALCAEMLHGKALVDTVCCKGCKHKITICKHFSMPSQCKSKLHISGNVHTWNLKRFWPSWPYSCWPFLLLSKGLSKMFLAQLWHCS